MPGENHLHPINPAKLARPPVPPDYLPRERLLERLEKSRQHPFTLVSAPAGYGKTALLSSWVAACDCPCAWLSLDEGDNDLRRFTRYFLSAIQTVYPDCLRRSLSLVNASPLPSPGALAHSLALELNLLERDFIQVVDNSHHIREKAVHDLLTDLLRHPLQHMHLVLAGRWDPFLPVSSLRARRRVSEIRVQDLRFTVRETSTYLQRMLGAEIEEATAAVWAEKTQGCAADLARAALDLRRG
jgi:LuxR family maltose regulon positive regulatory protein